MKRKNKHGYEKSIKSSSDEYFKYITNSRFAEYKKQQFLKLLSNWKVRIKGKKTMKTDLFEEAYGKDSLLDILSDAGFLAGIDISENTVKKASENAKKRRIELHGIKCDVRKIKFQKDYFDLIISNSTLDHMKNIEPALKEINRVMAKRGTLILTLVNKHNLPFRFLLFIERILKIGRVYSERCFYRDEVEIMLKENGFQVKRSGILFFATPLSRTMLNIIGDKNWISQRISDLCIRFFGILEKTHSPFFAQLIAFEAVKK